MKQFLFLFLIFSGIVFLSCTEVINNPADELNSITNLDVYITNDNYNRLLENRFSNMAVPADIYVNDSHINGYMEAQGAGSRFFPKWGYNIECKDGKTIDGLGHFNLSIQPYDRTMIRTALASYIYRECGFPVFYSSHAFMSLNGEPEGLYVMTETIDDNFFARRNLPVHELIKVVFGAKFTFNQKNDLEDNFEKKIPDDKNFSNLAEFIYAVDTVDPGNIFNGLGKYLDINEFLKYHAVTAIMNNSDGFTNNFYLYKENPSTPYRLIPWDFDKTFDPKAEIGLWGESKLIDKLFLNDSCYNTYISILRHALINNFNEENLYPIIDQVFSKIKDAYYLDPFLNNISLEMEVQALKRFIKERREYLLSIISN